jgi:predicted acylesterase/phospholipase RssA
MEPIMRPALVLLPLLLTASGCGIVPLYSHNNTEQQDTTVGFPRPVENLYRLVSLRPLLPENAVSGAGKASIETVPWNVKAACRILPPDARSRDNPFDCNDERFVALAISGGGSRAAVFSAAVMFELQRYGLLDHVDLVSCVSGGCLTAAYYALSCDDPQDPACPPTTNGARRYAWQEPAVYPLLERDLLWRWIGNWFWPTNILKFWFTHYDRTDIMAQTLSNNLYDRSILDNNQFRFRDLNPARPNLAINATNVTAGQGRTLHFAFTPEQFRGIHSDLDRLPIANAVMASASYPGAFNYVTLRDFRENRYIHLLDGGAYDNLGLNAIKTAMESPSGLAARQRLVIIIDSYPSPGNRLAKKAEPRGWMDYVVDSNFFVAYDTLLTSLRSTELQYARALLTSAQGTLLHVSWEGLDQDPQHARLARHLNRIPTSFNISSRNAEELRLAAVILVQKELKRVLCDPAQASDARTLRGMLSPEAPALTCD